MDISFQILRRNVNEKQVGDEGIYTVFYLKNGKILRASKGRFIVVAVEDDDGRWRFRIDVSMNYDEPEK